MNKTILTELRTYVVDALGKNGLFRQSFSTKVDSTVSTTSTQFLLQPNEVKALSGSNKLFQLRTDFPIEIVMTQTGPSVEEPEEPTVPEYSTATITASNFVAGQLLSIEVVDLDIPLATQEIRVVVFNTVSGETEQIMLQRVADHTFRGQQLTSYNGAATNFDEVLNCSHNDVIRVLYQDAKNLEGELQTVEVSVTASSPYTNTTLQVNAYLHVGKPVAIMMIDADITTPTYPCTVRNVTTGEEEVVLLNRTAPGTFIYSLPTTLNTGTPVSNDGVLQVSEQDVITVTVFDEHTITEPMKSQVVEVRPTAYTNGILSIPDQCVPNSNVTITFFDYDVAGSNHIDIPATNVRTGEFEYVRCYETVNGSGTFIGILVVSSDPTKNVTGDNVLHVVAGDSVRAVYVDVTSPNASSTVVQVESAVVAATPVVVAPEPEEEEEEDSDEEFTEQSVKIVCDGVFLFGGNFNGNITVRALQKPARCELLFV